MVAFQRPTRLFFVLVALKKINAGEQVILWANFRKFQIQYTSIATLDYQHLKVNTIVLIDTFKVVSFSGFDFSILDMAFALGAYEPNHNHLELLDLRSWSWESRPDYPFYSGLSHHANIAYNGGFIVFGGYSYDTDSNRSSIIAKFDVSHNQWAKLGDLISARYAINVVMSNGYFLVFGEYQTEKCSLYNTTISCTQQSPTVPNHLQLFHVPESFCTI